MPSSVEHQTKYQENLAYLNTGGAGGGALAASNTPWRRRSLSMQPFTLSRGLRHESTFTTCRLVLTDNVTDGYAVMLSIALF